MLGIQRMRLEEVEELLLQEPIVYEQVVHCSTQQCYFQICRISIIRTYKRLRISGSIQTPLNEQCPLQRVHFLGMFEKLDSNGL